MDLESIISYGRREFILQWHITNKCDMRCKHCYIPHKVKDEDKEKITIKRCYEIIDELSYLGKRWGLTPRINFSGGNPLLDDYFFELAKYSSNKRIRVGILGNPVLDKDLIQKLKEIPVWRYQISIDGLKENHEKIRGRGSYELAMRSLDMLIENNISTVVLSTVTKENMWDIPKLAEILFEKGVTIFDFSRLVPTGEASSWKDLLPEPKEYRNFLLKMYETYRKIKKKIPHVRIGVKDPLWMLLYKELGILKPIKQKEKIYGGCSIGINGFCIDVNGTCYSCRRLEIPIGNINHQNIFDIFINSKELNKERDYQKIEECSDCELLSVCRGCRAVAYHVNKSYFSKDPSCWKNER